MDLLYITEAVVRRCSMEKLFLKISKTSQENICARFPFFAKLQACNFVKKRLLTKKETGTGVFLWILRNF